MPNTGTHLKAHAVHRRAYQSTGPAGEFDTPRRKRRVEAKPLAELTIEVAGHDGVDFNAAWQLLVKAGLAASGTAPAVIEPALASWTLVIEVPPAPDSPSITLTNADSANNLADATTMSGIRDGLSTHTVATGRVAWTKFAKSVRRIGGAAELEWRLQPAP